MPIYQFLVKIKNNLNAIQNYFYDAKRYLRYSTTIKSPDDLKKIEARIIAHYHVIEKGMSIPEPRLGYGKSILFSLLRLLDKYEKMEFDQHRIIYQTALSVIYSYINFHRKYKYDISDIEILISKYYFNQKSCLGGVRKLTKKEIQKQAVGNFEELANSRYSIRNFSTKKVEFSLLKRAIKIAQKTPSVCNRQSWKVYIVQAPGKKEIIQKVQSGNRGFGEYVDTYLIVTSDLNSFDGIKERNQSFIDGGMFAMSLIYALHYLGLGTCALNWSVLKNDDKKLKKDILIADSENIVMLIAVGHVVDTFNVAMSTRKDIASVYSKID